MCCVVQLPPRALHHLHANAPHVPLASLVIVVVTVIKYVTTAKALLSCNVWQQRWHFYCYLPVFVFFYLIFFFDTMLPLFYYSFFSNFFFCVFLLFKQLRHFNCFQIRIFAVLSRLSRCADIDTCWHIDTYTHMLVYVCISASITSYLLRFLNIYRHSMEFMFHFILYNILAIYVHMYVLSAVNSLALVCHYAIMY